MEDVFEFFKVENIVVVTFFDIECECFFEGGFCFFVVFYAFFGDEHKVWRYISLLRAEHISAEGAEDCEEDGEEEAQKNVMFCFFGTNEFSLFDGVLRGEIGVGIHDKTLLL